MPHSSHLDQFRAAVRKELSDEQLRANRCDSFLEKIIKYQKGHGALPDEQQFLLWREDLEITMTVRALKAAMDLPGQDDQAYDRAPVSSPPGMSSGRGRSNGSMDSSAP
jgi:hypothetical protein